MPEVLAVLRVDHEVDAEVELLTIVVVELRVSEVKVLHVGFAA